MDLASGDLAAVLRSSRMLAGLTQRELAARAGVGVGALEDIEQGRTHRPRRQSLARLAMALGVGADQLAALADAGAVGGRRAGQPQGPVPAHAGAGLPDCGLRVGVLGPLAVWRGGRPVPLSPVRLRVVLGCLALYLETGLPQAVAVDALWGEDPPPTAATMVQAQVSRLRSVLGAQPGSAPGVGHGALIVRDGSCYRLSLGSVSLDIAEFGELTGYARRAVAAGDAVAACGWYERALALWRGRALEDLGALRYHPAVIGLDRRRADVVLEYASAAADAGLQNPVVAHLEALAAQEPLDERTHAQLMLTLAATGHQARALRVYQDLARRLDAELGVRPGPELVAAHLRVLRQQLPAAVATEISETERGVPRQLPARAPGFAGRVAELAVLDGILDLAEGCAGPVVISAIGGTAGVGKTALAIHWAHQVADRFPDGQLYVNLRGFGPSGTPMSPAAAVRLFLDGLGVAPQRIPAGLDAQAALYRSVLAGKRMLIVADNARDPEQVRPLLPGTSGCLVLVTSRNHLTGLAAAEGAHTISLDVLTEPEARELLSRRLGQRAAAEPAAAADLARLCARLPLALSIAAARATGQPALPLAALAAGLREAGNRLDELSTGEMATDVRTVLSWSCQQLTSRSDSVFRLLGVHPGPDISVPAAASLAGLPADSTRLAMAELARASLVTENTPGRFACHDLLRAYAAEQAGDLPEAQRLAAIDRMLDHYLHTACEASRLIYPHLEPIPLHLPRARTHPEGFAGRRQAMAWFRAERPVLLAVIGLAAADPPFSRYAWQLPWAMALSLDRAGHWPELAALQELGLAAASRDGNRAGQAAAHFYLSAAQMRMGGFAAATSHLTATLKLGQELGSLLLQAQAHARLSEIFELQGRKQDALRSAEEALRLFRAAGDPREACALNLVGWQYAMLGRYQETLRLCGQSVTLQREQANRYGEAAALDSLGYAHHHLDDHDQAVALYRQAIETLDNDGDIHLRCAILTHLGDASHDAGHPAAARQAWQHALAILDDLRHPDAEQVRSKLAAQEL